MTHHRRRAMALLAVTAMAVGAVSSSTIANFSDAESPSTNTFIAGTLDLTASPRSAAWTLDNMAPGSEEFRVVRVGSAGSLPLQYDASVTMDAQGDGKASTSPTSPANAGLGEVLKLRYRGVADASESCSANAASQVSEASAFTPGVAKAISLGTSTRRLEPGTSELLCFSFALPIETDNRYQADSAKFTLTFNGQQTSRE